MGTKRLRVLCVDDNHDIADSEADLLGVYGFDARASYDGRDALLTADEFCPDACLIDLNMPGMDGCAVAQELRAKRAASPALLVAITAMGGVEDFRRTKDAGFDAHLIKPVSPERLIEMLSAMESEC